MDISKRFRKEQWKMLLITMFCYLFFYTGRHNFGWATTSLAEDLNISFEKIGWISFSMLIGYAIGQLINGNLADRLSPRLMITIGGLLSVITNLIISFSDSFTAILILWTFNGYFQSMAWASGSRLISNWWGKAEKGKAFGFYTMSAGGSSVLTFFLAILLVQQDNEWRSFFRYPVCFLLVAILLFYLIARSRPSEKGFAGYDQDQEKNGSSPLSWKERYKAVLGNRQFMIASLAIGFQSMARYGLIFWVPVHFLGSNYKSDPHSLWITLLMPVGMALGAVSFGYISDLVFKRNRPASIRMGMLISALVALTIYFIPAEHYLLGAVFMLLSGFFVYGPQANFWAMSPELLGPNLVGTGIGIMNMFAYTFAAFGEPIFGRMIDITGSTGSVFIMVAVISALCAIIISFVNKGKKQTDTLPTTAYLTKQPI